MIRSQGSIYIAGLLLFAVCIMLYWQVLKENKSEYSFDDIWRNIIQTKNRDLKSKTLMGRTVTKSIYDPKKESQSRIKTVKQACKRYNVSYEGKANSRFVISEEYKFMINLIPKEVDKKRRRRIVIVLACLLACATLIAVTAGVIVAAGGDTEGTETNYKILNANVTDSDVYGTDATNRSTIGPFTQTDYRRITTSITTIAPTTGVIDYCSLCEYACVEFQCVCDLGFVLNDDYITCTDLGCNMQQFVSYPASGANLISTVSADTAVDCCSACTEEALCTIWTWHSNTQMCHIKKGNLSPSSAPMTAFSGTPMNI
ncbi:uncharacterized protein LOC144344400 [Saccoglossus kowalevskii]